MKHLLNYNYETSRKRIIRSMIILVCVFIYGIASGFLKEHWSLVGIEALLVSGFFVGGLPYAWFIASSIMRPHGYNERTDTEYYIGGFGGMALQISFGFTAGLFLGGILLGIDILRTILFLVSIRKASTSSSI